jgi:hypothetical protein
MNDETDHLDQIDEDILTSTLSDDAIEAAAGTERGGATQCWEHAAPCGSLGHGVMAS